MLCFPNSVSNFSMPVGPRTFRPPSQIMSSKTFKLQNGWVLLLCCLTLYLCIKHLLFFVDKYSGALNGHEGDICHVTKQNFTLGMFVTVIKEP